MPARLIKSHQPTHNFERERENMEWKYPKGTSPRAILEREIQEVGGLVYLVQDARYLAVALHEALERIAELEEALRFYADRHLWEEWVTIATSEPKETTQVKKACVEYGEHARKVLPEYQEEA